jgi:hypothetical protein
MITTRLIDNIRKTRTYVIDHVKELSLEKLNLTPHGFNNNIFWNIGHLVAAQMSICYIKGGLKPSIPQNVYAAYMPGTKPERFFDNNEEDEIKQLLITSLDTLESDYLDNYFSHFSSWTNRYGTSLSNIDEALTYLQFHEGLHLGVIMSQRKLVQKG